MPYQIPKYIISIKKIKDILIEGTSISYSHETFAKLLFVDTSCLLTEQYFEDTILKNDSAFNLFINGNLRKDCLSYAISKSTKYLLSINKHKTNCVFESLRDAFEDTIMADIFKSIEDTSGNKLSYTNVLFENLRKLICKENLYYNELYDEVNDKLQKKVDLSNIFALLCLIAIFQDNIYLLFPDKYRTRWSTTDNGFFPHSPKIPNISDTVPPISMGNFIPIETNAFFNFVLSNNYNFGKISEIDMAFHSGYFWRTDEEKVEIIKNILKRNIKIRIIINAPETINDICIHMCNPLQEYPDFDTCILSWKKLMQHYPDLVSFRISTVPLMHRIYIVRDECNNGVAHISYYTYGNYITKKDKKICIDNTDETYNLYIKEFEYLWDKTSYQYDEEYFNK